MINNETIVGIIGGTSVYDLEQLKNREEIDLETSFGKPSSKIITGYIDEVKVCFISRHGVGHTLLPSEVNYQANIIALKQLGVTWCIGVSAVGSLRDDFKPGDIVIPDQIIDNTKSRKSTFYGNGIVVHIPFADPYCSFLRKKLIDACKQTKNTEFTVHESGTYICIDGPQLSTRAESHLYKTWGADIIGMTNQPEAKLAREAEISYSTIALVTDYDCWKSKNSDVDIQDILNIMKKNSIFAKNALNVVLPTLQSEAQPEHVSEVLKFSIITALEDIPENTLNDLKPLLKKYTS